MMEKAILELINKAGKFSEEESLLLMQAVQFRTIKKDEILLMKGDICSSVCFVVSGSFYQYNICLLYTSPSPRDATLSRMPSSA